MELVARSVFHRDAGCLWLAMAAQRLRLVDQPDDHEALAQLGQTLVAEKRFAEARISLGRALILDSSSPLILRNLARLAMQDGSLEGADHLLQQAAHLDSGAPETRLLLASLACARGQVDKAMLVLDDLAASSHAAAEVFAARGMVHLQSGRADLARSELRRALALKPQHPDFWRLMGTVHQRAGEDLLTLAAMGRYAELLPADTAVMASLASVWHNRGRPDLAVGYYRRIAFSAARDPALLVSAGSAWQDLCCRGEAVACYRQALVLDPAQGVACANLGSVTREIPGEQRRLVRRAAILRPDLPEAPNTLGILLKDRSDQAMACFLRSLVLRPDFAEGLCNFGNALHDQAREDPAIVQYHRALAVDPVLVQACFNLGNAEKNAYRIGPAIESYCRALALTPDYVETISNLGVVLKESGRFDEALAHYDRGLQLRPGWPELLRNRSLVCFALGRLVEAWRDYEFRMLPVSPSTVPRWSGQPIPGKALLVTAEQGVADQMHAASMLNDVVGLVGSLVVQCDRRLTVLFSRSFPGVTIVPADGSPHPAVLAADYQIPMFSLAQYFRCRIEDFPQHRGYLKPSAARVAHWRQWLDSLGSGPKVGISWRGRLVSWNRARNFADLASLGPLLQLSGCTFVNLQYDGFLQDLRTLERMHGAKIEVPPQIDLTEDLDEVAALMEALDAVVGPDTAVCLMAGALGRPTWMYVAWPGSNNEKDLCGEHSAPWWPSVRVELWPFGADEVPILRRLAESLAAFLQV